MGIFFCFLSPSCTGWSILSGKVFAKKLYTFTRPVPLATRSTDTRFVWCVSLMYCAIRPYVFVTSVGVVVHVGNTKYLSRPLRTAGLHFKSGAGAVATRKQGEEDDGHRKPCLLFRKKRPPPVFLDIPLEHRRETLFADALLIVRTTLFYREDVFALEFNIVSACKRILVRSLRVRHLRINFMKK